MRACFDAVLRRRKCIDAVRKRRREGLLSVTFSVVKQNAKVFHYISAFSYCDDFIPKKCVLF